MNQILNRKAFEPADGRLSATALDQLFRQARTHNGWLDQPVPHALLEEAVELAKLGPTAAHPPLPRLFPHADVRPIFADNEAVATHTAVQNGTLQLAYFILALRALGLDTGPMGGFDKDKVDAEFFAGTKTRSNVLVNIGYGDHTK